MIDMGRIEWVLCLWTNFLLYIGCNEPQKHKKPSINSFSDYLHHRLGFDDFISSVVRLLVQNSNFRWWSLQKQLSVQLQMSIFASVGSCYAYASLCLTNL